MEYRKLPHGEEQISVIGLGNSSLTSQVGEKEIQATVEMALESGVNYFDMAAGDAAPFAAYGKALACCGCGVSERVKRVRALANRFVKSRHLSNTARVVRNGTVSVGGKRYAES